MATTIAEPELPEGGLPRAIGVDTAAERPTSHRSQRQGGQRLLQKKTSWTMDASATAKAKPLCTAAGSCAATSPTACFSWCFSCSPRSFSNTALPVMQQFHYGPAPPAYFPPEIPGPQPRGPPPPQPEQRPGTGKTKNSFEASSTSSPPREPEPPSQGQATALVAKGQQPVEAMFKDVMIASQLDLESQIEALLPGSDPDEYVKDGLTSVRLFSFAVLVQQVPSSVAYCQP